MKFADTLPAGCPPPAAIAVETEYHVFRIVESEIPTKLDFTSLWQRNPEKRSAYSKNECLFRALSIWATQALCEKARLLPTLKSKSGWICRLTLQPGAGMILHNTRTGHISWWAAQGFNPLENCEVL